jgi:hypothetical protein
MRLRISKYKLAKAFLRWSRDHKATGLTGDEQAAAKKLMNLISAGLAFRERR